MLSCGAGNHVGRRGLPGGLGDANPVRSGAVAIMAQEPEHIFITKCLEIFGGNVGLVEIATYSALRLSFAD